jgi:hypothetical protein
MYDKNMVGVGHVQYLCMYFLFHGVTTMLIVAFFKLYALLLAFLSVCLKPKWSTILAKHLNSLLLVTVVVYFYRDILPLSTYTSRPLDVSEGWILWSKISVLTFTGLVLPLVIPRQYVPVNPEVSSSKVLESLRCI